MEAEYHKLKPAPSFKFKNTAAAAAAISREGLAEIDELPRYTSLKDVMASHSPRGGGGGSGANRGEIAIRNELVKHAASAYLLSAATVVNPANRGGDFRMLGRMRRWWLGLVSCWQVHVGLPLCWPFANFVYRIVHRVRNCLRGVVELS